MLTKLIKDWEESRARLDKAGKALEAHFQPIYRAHLRNNDFIAAKESLRKMPDSAQKVLMFREIIIQEDYNNKTYKTYKH